MVQSQFCLSWDSHKSSICHGFSALQQNGEFVDMTLAADGHFVKVHQMVMALASPYLKELITSAPCQHPVIFLNNVSHKSLCSLLEYIYTGEVIIPTENLSSFIDTAKALHIKGLEDVNSSDCLPIRMALNASQLEGADIRKIMSGHDKRERMNIPVTRKIVLKPDMHTTPGKLKTASSEVMTDYSHFGDDPAEDPDDGHNYGNQPTSVESTPLDQSDVKEMPTSLQFTVSIRGSLQAILNRYIYNLNSVTQRTGVRRWRCVDYRNHKCMAFVVTKNNVVLSRGNLHNHPFHDKKILSKIERNAVYSALDDIEGYKDKEPIKDASKDDTAAGQEFLSLDFEDNESDAIMKDT